MSLCDKLRVRGAHQAATFKILNAKQISKVVHCSITFNLTDRVSMIRQAAEQSHTLLAWGCGPGLIRISLAHINRRFGLRYLGIGGVRANIVNRVDARAVGRSKLEKWNTVLGEQGQNN
jgi:hypothetical protein